MPLDWIKVEAPTPNKPEILRLARLLGVTKDDAFGKAMRFWLWLDGVTVDGVVDGVTSTDVDAVVGCDRFAASLVQVGWLICDDEAQMVEVPNFCAHNGASAKARANKTRRQAKWRAGSVDDDVDKRASTKPSTRLDKNREEYSSFSYSYLMTSFSIPKELQEEDFARAWEKWVAHRKEIKKPLKKTMVEGQLKMLAEKGREAAIRMIDHTVAMGWQGLRDPEPARNPAAGNGSMPPEDDFEEFVKRNLKGAKHDR
jgi:hypothetical protein